MSSELPTAYLAGLSPARREELAAVNVPGLRALVERLEQGSAVAFLGAGASAPLYPLWDETIGQLIDIASDRLGEAASATCRAMAASNPDAVVEIVRNRLGAVEYREALRTLFRPRRDPQTGRTWSPTHELVARCNFAGVITTNYDPGILNARMHARPTASGTGFASWPDDDALDRWRTGDVFGDDELPVLYAHGRHSHPDTIVLATNEYRIAYGGKLARVLGRIVDSGSLVWIGFSFADSRIAAILREVAEGAGTRTQPGATPRHVAVMPWDPSGGDGSAAGANDPDVLRELIEIQFGCRAVLYPVDGTEHSALQRLLEECVDPSYSETTQGSVDSAPPVPVSDPAELPVRWVHGGYVSDHFTGRTEELAHLARWARDSTVRLVGVTAWGGAGKTTLVTQWINARGADQRGALRGVFAWSFYEDGSADRWASELIAWVQETFGVRVDDGPPAVRVLRALRRVPLLLLLDGLEVTQEAPNGTAFGRLLDGTLRDALTGMCERTHESLVVLTSRFPFADLERFDGGAVRMLDVPAFTPSEGAMLLERAGGDWLSEEDRRDLSAAVDGHALAIEVLAGLLAERPDWGRIEALRAVLAAAQRTDTRVARVLEFYRRHLSDADEHVVALVSMFPRPVDVGAIVELGGSEAFGAALEGWSAHDVEAAVRQRLTGLLNWHSDGAISAHPLVRDTFRSLVLDGRTAARTVAVVLADLPDGAVRSRDDALRVVEGVELLLDAGEWKAAHALAQTRVGRGIWRALPAARLGQRSAGAFLATPERRATCEAELGRGSLAWYLNEAGLCASFSGDIAIAQHLLRDSVAHYQALEMPKAAYVVHENLCSCDLLLGDAAAARKSASDAIRTSGSPTAPSAAAYLGAALHLAGETAAADEQFIVADEAQLAVEANTHLYSLRGNQWARFLLQTGRAGAARRLAEAGLEICRRNGWNEDVARCNHVLGWCELEAGRTVTARSRIEEALETFQAGDLLVEAGAAMCTLASALRLDGALDHAERACDRLVTLAGPRELVPFHGSALATWGQLHCDRFLADGDADRLERAQDNAELVLRLATRVRRLPWLELAGLELHVRIDDLSGRDEGWSSAAAELRSRLLPAGLDLEPLATAAARAVAADPP